MNTPPALSGISAYNDTKAASSYIRTPARFRISRVVIGMLALLLGGTLLAGCGGDSVDACAEGIRETVALENAAMTADRKLDAAVEDDASPERVEDLRRRYEEASIEAGRRRLVTAVACDLEVRSGRDRTGSEAACSAALEVWGEAAEDLAEAQTEWANAVRGWNESPGDVSAARASLSGDEPSRRLADAYEARADAYISLEIARGRSESTWAWAACGDFGQAGACAQGIDLVVEWGGKSLEADEAADAKVASYTTPEDDTASVLSDIARGTQDVAENAC